MLIVGSVGLGSVAGWWLLMRPVWGARFVMVAIAVPAAVVAGVWLVGGDLAAPAALAGTVGGAVAHGIFRMAICRFARKRRVT